MTSNDTKYEELVGKYIEYKKQADEFEKLKKEIADEIDRMMCADRINEKKVFINELNQTYECKYVDRKTKTINYILLSELIDEEDFNEVVQENKTTYLKISLPKKEKVIRQKPVADPKPIRSQSIPKAKVIK